MRRFLVPHGKCSAFRLTGTDLYRCFGCAQGRFIDATRVTLSDFRARAVRCDTCGKTIAEAFEAMSLPS